LAPKNQVHDFHPPIAESGLYWVVPIPAGGLTYADGGRTATIDMHDVPVIDQPRWPALDALGTPATLSFRLVFKATDQRVTYDDPYKQFRFTGWQATAELEAQVHVPSIGFSWKSDPLATSHCDFAILGDEMNGKYYDAEPKAHP
jgi:hypothetical protein